ncbi:hypothetical protein F5I97DRAFT_1663146 [Phlebopus sp. FC_14]|nr:hypothetical protein F5I97DRAFT_1663146 [Phlebopus sp. FC_14]
MSTVYNPLPTTDYEVAEERCTRSRDDCVEDTDDGLALPWKIISSCPLTVACFFAVSLAAYVLFILDARVQMSYGGNVKHDALRYPSVYIGLEKLTRNATSPSWPLSIIRPVDYVTSVNANAASHVASPDQSLVLEPNSSFVLQYRVRDHGLENCAVYLRPPRNASMTEEMDGAEVTAWLLEESSSGSIQNTIDWSTKPKRQTFLGRFNISSPHAVSHSSSFPCRTRSQVLIELSFECASQALCSVGLGSNRTFSRHAISIIQSEAPFSSR